MNSDDKDTLMRSAVYIRKMSVGIRAWVEECKSLDVSTASEAVALDQQIARADGLGLLADKLEKIAGGAA